MPALQVGIWVIPPVSCFRLNYWGLIKFDFVFPDWTWEQWHLEVLKYQSFSQVIEKNQISTNSTSTTIYCVYILRQNAQPSVFHQWHEGVESGRHLPTFLYFQFFFFFVSYDFMRLIVNFKNHFIIYVIYVILS